MKRYLSILLTSLVLAAGLTSCMDDFDAPDVSQYSIFSPTSVGTVNTTLSEVKNKFCKSNAGATYSRNASNWEFKVEEDLVFEAVVVSNDGQWGAMYQQVILRSLDGEELKVCGQNVGHCIQLGVKNTCLYPYFKIGQRLKINLKGLYVGAYSKTPKIGFPYFTSAGNHNLGPMPFEMCATNIELVGTADTACAECRPVDLTDAAGLSWMADKKNQTYRYCPMFASVRGFFPLADGSATLAPDELEDAGYAVDREFMLSDGKTKVTVRTSTGNELSHIVMPRGYVSISGVLSYYDGWQIQFRELEDMRSMDN